MALAHMDLLLSSFKHLKKIQHVCTMENRAIFCHVHESGQYITEDSKKLRFRHNEFSHMWDAKKYIVGEQRKAESNCELVYRTELTKMGSGWGGSIDNVGGKPKSHH